MRSYAFIVVKVLVVVVVVVVVKKACNQSMGDWGASARPPPPFVLNEVKAGQNQNFG